MKPKRPSSKLDQKSGRQPGSVGRISGPPDSPLNRLKLLWRDSLSETDRDYWREQMASLRPLPDLRDELNAQFKIELVYDGQLSFFHRWVEKLDRWHLEAELAVEAEAELAKQGLSGDQLRGELLKRMKTRALAQGDFDLGATAVTLDLKAEQVAISQRRLTLLERKAAAFDRAQEALAEARNSEGGLSPETIAKIERELNLF